MKRFIFFTIALLGTLSVQGQNVGIGTATPLQRLHVAGSTLTDNAFAATTLNIAAATAINITQPATQVRITDDGGASANAISYTATAIEGQYLWITNNDADVAIFTHTATPIPSNRTMGFVYVGGAWREVFAYPPVSVTANNGLYVVSSGDTVRLGGNLIQNTTITNNGFSLAIAGSTVTTTFTTAGNVGIGTATPTQRLHVSGGSILTDRAYAATTLVITAAAAINITQPATQVRITDDGGASANAISYTATAIEGQYLWITNNDADPATFAGVNIPSNSVVGFVYTGSAWRPVRAPGIGDDWRITGNTGTDQTVNFIGTTDAQGLTVRTNNLERFRFSGTAYQLLSMANGTFVAPAYSWNGETNTGIYRGGAGQLNFTTQGTERLRLTNTPQILSIGNGTAAAPAWSWVGDENLGIYRIGADVLGISTNGTQRFRINADGEVLVGTGATSPLTGDLLNAVAYGAMPFAVNGYTTLNGTAVFGSRRAGASGEWGTIQGEDVSGVANASGVVGMVNANSMRGVYGWKPTGGFGWGGLFLNDLGYSGGLFFISDKRFKKDIQSIGSVLPKIMSIVPYTYHYTLDLLGGDAYNYYGFMAQDVEKVFPDFVAEKSVVPNYSRTNPKENGKYDNILNSVKTVNMMNFIPILVKGMQEQQNIIDEQNKKIQMLEERIKKLEESR